MTGDTARAAQAPAGGFTGTRLPTSVSLAVVAARVQHRIDAVLAGHGMNFRKYGVLGHLQRSPGLSFSELARRSGITVQSMHALMSAMAEAGLVHGRATASGAPAAISITNAGVVLLDQLAHEFGAVDAEFFGDDSRPAWVDLGRAVRAVVADEVSDGAGRS